MVILFQNRPQGIMKRKLHNYTRFRNQFKGLCSIKGLQTLENSKNLRATPMGFHIFSLPHILKIVLRNTSFREKLCCSMLLWGFKFLLELRSISIELLDSFCFACAEIET